MPAYKVCYFDATGLAEMLRLMFAEAGVQFEDVRYKWIDSDDWPKNKPEMMFNQIPVLFVDGEQIAHSRAALRYLAREFKMDGGDSLTTAKMDMWIEVLVEAFMKIPFPKKGELPKHLEGESEPFQCSACPDGRYNLAMWNETIKPKLQKLNDIMKGDYVFGDDKPSALDVIVYVFLDDSLQRQPDCLKDHPKIKAMMAAFEERPNIATYLAERPKPEF